MNKKIISFFVVLIFVASALGTVTNAKRFCTSKESPFFNQNINLLYDVPYQPSNPNPPNESVNVDVNIILGWDGGDPDLNETVYYDIYLGIETNPPFVERIGPYPASQIRITYDIHKKLNYNTQYHWRIDAIDSYGYTTTGPSWVFTTADDHPPYKPSDPYPPDEATNVPTNIDLSWTGGDPDLGDIVKYDVYFGTDPNPPNVMLKQPETTYNPGILKGNTQYYWRIDGWDDYGYSVTGDTWTFKTEMQPNKPTISGPTSGKINVKYTYITSTTDPDGDQIYYMFDWGDGSTSGWLGPHSSGNTVEAEHIWTSKGSYQVKVKAKDIYDAESDWSDPLPVSISKSRYVIFDIINHLLDRFPFLHLIIIIFF